MKVRPLGELSCVKRDLIAAIASNPGANGQELWSEIEHIRQDTVSNTTIRNHLDELADGGLVQTMEKGNEVQYRLTTLSRKRLEYEAEWLAEI